MCLYVHSTSTSHIRDTGILTTCPTIRGSERGVECKPRSPRHCIEIRMQVEDSAQKQSSGKVVAPLERCCIIPICIASLTLSSTGKVLRIISRVLRILCRGRNKKVGMFVPCVPCGASSFDAAIGTAGTGGRLQTSRPPLHAHLVIISSH